MRNPSSLKNCGLLLCCFALIEAYVLWSYRGPEPRDAGDHFSAVSARALHQELFPPEPHPAGSAANQETKQRIIQRLVRDGWTIDPSSLTTPDGNIAAFRNDLLTRDAKPLVFASHYDSCRFGPGAGDAAACVVAIIESTKLITQYPDSIRRPVWLLFTDAEENGLDGARDFVASHPISQQTPFVLNFDSRGTSGPVVMFETQQGDLEVVRQLANHLPRPRLTGSLFTAVYRMLPNSTDFSVFRDAGWSGCNFALIDGAHRYHQPDDTLENLDIRSLQHFGETVHSIGKAVACTDGTFSSPGEDTIFFDVLGLHVFHFPTSWNRVLRFVLLFTAVQIYGRSLLRQRELRKAVWIWLTMALMLPGAAFGGWIFSRSLIGTSLLQRPFVAHGHLISLSLWMISLASGCAYCRMMLRRVSQSTIWSAFWLGQAATCLVVSIMLPEASYLLSVPAILALIVTPLIRDVRRRTILVTLGAALLLIPLHHLLSIAMGPASGLILAPAFILLLMPALPLFGTSTDRQAGTTNESGMLA